MQANAPQVLVPFLIGDRGGQAALKVLVLTVLCLLLADSTGHAQGTVTKTEPGNCGAMCLYVTMAAENVEVPAYQQFLGEHDWAKEANCTLADLSNASAKLGLPSHLIQFGKDVVPEFEGHMIAYVEPQHFVIVSRLPDGAISWCDPPTLPRPITPQDIDSLGGAGLLFGQAASRSWSLTGALAITGLVILIAWAIRHFSIRRRDN